MYIKVAKDASEWNAIVDKSPLSVLYHRYEICSYDPGALPLLIKERNRSFVFPLSVVNLLKSFGLATSSIFFHVSLLPDTSSDEALDLVPKALDRATNFLRAMRVDYLCTCGPTFFPREYVNLLDLWFKKRKAGVQTIYAHMIRTKNVTFEDVWKHRFEKRTKNRIRKTEREGVSIMKISTVDGFYEWIEDIHRCNVSALKRQGRWGAYPDSYKEVFLSELILLKRLLGEYFNMHAAIYRGRLIAYFILQEYNRLMQVTKAMSHTNFLDKYPNEALIAHIVKEACEHGCDYFQYGWDRVRWGGRIPSLNPSLQRFKLKFGFEEVPIHVFRLGLTRRGRMIQHLYSSREHVVTGSTYLPESIKDLSLRLYVPKRRQLSVFSHA